jgi:hypothetical protein
MKVKFILVLTAMLYFTMLQAYVRGVYQDKLSDIEEKVDISFNGEFSFFDKYDGILKLHDFIFNQNESFPGIWGEEGLIKEVILYNPDMKLSETKIYYPVAFYGNSIFYPIDGEKDIEIKNSFTFFKNELVEIEIIEKLISEKLPNITLVREKDYSDLLGPNISYLNALRAFYNVLEKNKYINILSGIKKIMLVDTSLSSSSLVYKNVDKEGEIDFLKITFEQKRKFDIVEYVDSQFIESIIDIVCGYGFNRIDFLLLGSHDPGQVINNLKNFLSHNYMYIFLISEGVKSFHFSDYYENESDLFIESTGKLTLGPNIHDMEKVVNKVFK